MQATDHRDCPQILVPASALQVLVGFFRTSQLRETKQLFFFFFSPLTSHANTLGERGRAVEALAVVSDGGLEVRSRGLRTRCLRFYRGHRRRGNPASRAKENRSPESRGRGVATRNDTCTTQGPSSSLRNLFPYGACDGSRCTAHDTAMEAPVFAVISGTD